MLGGIDPGFFHHFAQATVLLGRNDLQLDHQAVRQLNRGLHIPILPYSHPDAPLDPKACREALACLSTDQAIDLIEAVSHSVRLQDGDA